MATQTNTRVLSEIADFYHDDLIDLLRDSGLLSELKESGRVPGVFILNEEPTQ